MKRSISFKYTKEDLIQFARNDAFIKAKEMLNPKSGNLCKASQDPKNLTENGEIEFIISCDE